ncbi:MAG: DegT/DnrJ/EryC1/StrS family aminotransferase [Phycisphaeraceae bacterium]|nr:DegT/DnrJ/EryC1/StrS family aminotransferase [Phycisphaeraceae bacterium]MCW5763102.1 DegT/DnrJ/EryC1/StrS family aminotransferase [Phycisphaeraceae bacterium]
MSQKPTVPLLDLKAQYASLREEIEPVIRQVVEAQWFIMGPEVSTLEKEIAAYCGTKHAIGCASGSDALLLALMALDVGPGDEVLCPSFTFFATGGAVARLGAKPVYVDIDPVTYNMCPKHARAMAKTCTRLKAIMPVHLFGQAVDMDEFLEIGKELNVPIIEDAAQAIGTRDKHGITVGSRGTIGCFSFFPSKNLGGFGDGGIITTNDDELAAKMGILRIHGGQPKYYHSIIGINSRLDALQAAILRIKLRHLESWHAGRQANAAFYDEQFAKAGATTSATPLNSQGLALRTPAPAPRTARHIYNQYVIRVPGSIRDELRAHLQAEGIGTEIYYPVPLHMQECFAYLGQGEGALPESEAAAAETIALPIYPELTVEQKQHVVQTTAAFVAERAAVTA